MRWRHAVLGFVITVPLLMMGLDLWARFQYEFQGPMTWDTPLYLAVGRGMLNGLLPYRDLFESKPPGIFLLSSLSLWAFGDITLAAIAQALALAVFPLSMLIIASRLPMERGPLRYLVLAIAFLFGGTLALYTGERSGEMQVESFGAGFSALYIATVFPYSGQMRWGRTVVAGCMLLGAIGMKEPFFLSTLAAALFLFAHTPKCLVRVYLWPFCVAMVVGGIVLGMLGYLGPYVSIYLPQMVGSHLRMMGPWWERGLLVGNLWRDIGAYAPLFQGVLAVCVCVFLFQQCRRRERWVALLCTGIGVYLAVLSVGLEGHFFNHHFVFAVPAYMALFSAVIAHPWEREHAAVSWRKMILVPLVALVLFLGVRQPEISYAARLSNVRRGLEQAQQIAVSIDGILDRCNLASYLFLGTNGLQPYAYTKHSPLGPAFIQYDYLATLQSPFFRETFLQNLEKSPLVVVHNPELQDMRPAVEQYLAVHFTNVPWPCAGSFSDPAPYSFLFRLP